MNVLPLVIAGAVGLYFLRRGIAAKDIEPTLEGVRFAGNISNLEIFVKLGLINKSNARILINSINMRVERSGTTIATVDRKERFYIQPQQKTVTELKLRVVGLGLLSNILSIITGGGAITVDLVGNVNAEGVNFPISYKNIVLKK